VDSCLRRNDSGRNNDHPRDINQRSPVFSDPVEALLYYLPTKWISANGMGFCMLFSGTGEFDSFNAMAGTLVLQSSHAAAGSKTLATAHAAAQEASPQGTPPPTQYLPIVARSSSPCNGQ